MECEKNVDNSALPKGGDSTFKEQIFDCKTHTKKLTLFSFLNYHLPSWSCTDIYLAHREV